MLIDKVVDKVNKANEDLKLPERIADACRGRIHEVAPGGFDETPENITQSMTEDTLRLLARCCLLHYYASPKQREIITQAADSVFTAYVYISGLPDSIKEEKCCEEQTE